jgi:hypothetical protein
MSDTFHFATGPDDDKPMPVDGAHRWRGMMLNLLDASNDQLKRGGPGSITIDRHQLITLASALERYRRMEVQMGLIGKTISSLIER